ncbi:MAG: hypothetical protein K8S22_15680 [Betaproteobacteria bacterium]|nr:hypothetical protein [Betaproteobacteria bacterium]
MHTKPQPRRISAQSGQALVEFTIAAATVLLPLFLIIPLLGKYFDMKASAIQAARYAAWERTVWFGSSDWAAGAKDDLQIQREVQQRFFSDTATAKLQSAQGSATGWGGPAGVKPLWRDRAGNPMLASYDSDVTQAAARTQTPGTMDAILTPVVNVVNVVDAILGSKFELDMKSLYTSTVNVQTVATLPIRNVMSNTSTSSGTPAFRMTNVLVANGWSANGPDNVKAQVEGLTPTSVSQRDPLKTILTIAQYIFTVIAPELMPDWLKFGGEIQPDVVPDDRLK